MPSPGSSRGAALGLSLFWLAGMSVGSSGSPSSSGSILTARGRAKGCEPLPETLAPLLTAVPASPGTSHQGNVVLPQPCVRRSFDNILLPSHLPSCPFPDPPGRSPILPGCPGGTWQLLPCSKPSRTRCARLWVSQRLCCMGCPGFIPSTQGPQGRSRGCRPEPCPEVTSPQSSVAQ